ncbi:hypothetical protein Taro_048182 [Colocasia esculenta]|uniref:Uncharacterized protein n=1 Tax=Colocasia esculenta TaxID=4460 RepID=A0A843X685_COLES|nr:hypothetical protein [Colocasia esculenta]
MAVPKKGTRALLAHPCRVAFRWLAFQQGPSVSCRRVLLLLLSAHATSVIAVFARAAVGFVLGLRVRVGVSQRLREPTCGVAFTSAGLWSAELVEGVLALLAVPLLLGCVFVGCPPCYWGVSLLDVPLVVGVCVVLAVCLASCACAPLGAVLCSVDVLLELSRCLCAVLHAG